MWPGCTTWNVQSWSSLSVLFRSIINIILVHKNNNCEVVQQRTMRYLGQWLHLIFIFGQTELWIFTNSSNCSFSCRSFSISWIKLSCLFSNFSVSWKKQETTLYIILSIKFIDIIAIWLRLKLFCIYKLIDWCLPPTLAIFKLYRGGSVYIKE